MRTKTPRKILFISTNNVWSGSEELWVRSASQLESEGHQVTFVTKYKHNELSKLNGKHYIFSERFKKSMLAKALKKLTGVSMAPTDVVSAILKKEQPHLILLSQGNNIDHDGIMNCCSRHRIPYFSITHLVSEFFFLYITDNNLQPLRNGYLEAEINFFVSSHNRFLNDKMLSFNLTNAAVIYNPIKVNEHEIPAYPIVNNAYNIALVGRLECFHKGYDLLLEVAGLHKWKDRNIRFNIYGSGPHYTLLSERILHEKLSNVVLKGYENNVAKIWADNHILFMPSRMEGQALSLIEAMFCNRAAIVTNVGGASELINDGQHGFIAEVASVKSLNQTLERAWQQRESWQQLGINAGLKIRTSQPADAVSYFNEILLNHSPGD